MSKFSKIIRNGFLYLSALSLVAGYPLTAMADTQEPGTSLVGATSKTSTPEPSVTYTPESQASEPQAEPESSTVTETSPATPTIIEPESTAQPTADDVKTEVDRETQTNVDTTVNVETDLASDATSGDSTVKGNTSAGNAITGNANGSGTVLNVVNSTVGTGNNQKVATFTHDIMGDVKGDIVLHPMLLKAMLEAKANEGASASVNANTNFNLNNNLDISATSGNATVSQNTKAGNATTGSANAVANVVNILNSMIATQDSFVGTINIYGNLEGDILIAPDFIPQMLASNKDTNATGDMVVSKQDTTNIVNSISAVAESGAANVLQNTKAGNATTGDALSNVVIFNISGHEVIAKNSLLVFVNVLGQWVGVIVDAPANATAAMIGNGVTSNTKYSPDLTIDSELNHSITNTIKVNAKSGDATVSQNTEAGNATSGDANAMVNLANVSNTSFGLSDWFGVLFINVFQSWHGSFGIDTAYGNPVKTPDTPAAPAGPIEFVPAENRTPRNTSVVRLLGAPAVQASTLGVSAAAASQQSILADSTVRQQAPVSSSSESQPSSPFDYRLLIIGGSILIVGASIIGIRRLIKL